MTFQLPLTSFGSTENFTNGLQSQSRLVILLGAGDRIVKDKAYPAPKEV